MSRCTPSTDRAESGSALPSAANDAREPLALQVIIAQPAPSDSAVDPVPPGAIVVDVNLYEICLWPSEAVICAAQAAPATGLAAEKDEEAVAKKSQRRRSKKPAWDPASGRLLFDGVLVKKLRRDAENQVVVLVAFSQAGWAKWIADPLPRDGTVDAHDRLFNTVKRLNAQKNALITFFCDGFGTGICWKPR